MLTNYRYRTVIRILQGSTATFLEMQLKKNLDLVVEYVCTYVQCTSRL